VAPTFYKFHFFDPTQGRVALRLLQFVGFGTLVEGVGWGTIVCLIARRIAFATHPAETAY
jgi:hypothetical protein